MSTEETTDIEIDESAIQERTWPHTVVLRNPFDLGKKHFAELEFREGCLGDLKGIKIGKDGMSIDQVMLVASRMCGQPTQVIEKLKGKDAAEVMAIARDFFSECLTG